MRSPFSKHLILGVSINGDLQVKKSFIALAALATVATSVQAQSSVTVYGVMDMGITTVDKVGTTAATASRNTGLTSGGLSTPRFGFKGSEDLGSGLKATFVLESEIIADTGTSAIGSDSGILFNRESTVALSQNGVGTVKLGRQNAEDYNFAAKYDAFGSNNIGGWVASNKGGSSSSSATLDVNKRYANAVGLQSAPIMGVVFTVQHAFGESAGAPDYDRSSVYAAEYSHGPFGLAIAHANQNSSGATTHRTSLYAKYDFNVVDLRFGYASKETSSTTTFSGYFVGFKAPISTNIGLIGQYNKFDSDTGEKPSVSALGATYAFSKRTTAYLIGAKSNQNNNSTQYLVSDSKYQNFNAVAAGVNQTALSIGIRHTF